MTLMKRFVCDRRVPRSDDIVIFEIEAIKPWEASAAASEMALAVAWHRGYFNDGPKPRPPEQWALDATHADGARLGAGAPELAGAGA